MEGAENFVEISTIVNAFIERINGGFAAGLPLIRRLVYLLLSIDIAILGIKAMFGEAANLGTAVRKVLFIGIWLYLVFNIQTITNALLKLLVNYGLDVAGIEEEFTQKSDAYNILSRPMSFIKEGIEGLSDMFIRIPGGLSNIVNKLFGLIVMLIGTLCFAFIYMLMVISLLEFHLLVLCSSLLLAFCFTEQTKFLGEKGLTAIASVAIRLMVLIIVIGITMPLVISSMEVLTISDEGTGNLNIQNFLYILILVLFAAYLCSQATNIASALTGAGAGIAPGGMMGMVAGAAMGAISNIAHIKKENGNSKLEGFQKAGRAIAGGVAETMGASKQASKQGRGSLKAGLKAAGSSLVRSTTGASREYLKNRYMQGRMSENIQQT